MNIALIIAGGSGNRMGQDIPKQFMHIDGAPVILYNGLVDGVQSFLCGCHGTYHKPKHDRP